MALQWCHNDHDGVSNHQPHGCLLNRLFRRKSKKISKLRVTGLCVGNSSGPVNSPHKGPFTRKMFPFDDVIIVHSFDSSDADNKTWWHHQMETFSALLANCAGDSPVTGEFPAQRPVTRSFDIFFDLRPNKQLSKQYRGWWFETPSRPLWRPCNDIPENQGAVSIRKTVLLGMVIPMLKIRRPTGRLIFNMGIPIHR